MNLFKQFAHRVLGAPALAASAPAGEAAHEEGGLPMATLPPLHGAPFTAAGPDAREASNQPAFPPPHEDRAAAAPVPARRGLPQGVLDLPPLRGFLEGNHFGLGRHNGSQFRTAEARDQGVRALVAEFQAIVSALCAREQAHLDRLDDALLQAEGVCEATTRRLRAAMRRHERELAALREQLALADQGEGWVRQAIARYQLGFAQGLQAAMDADYLGL